MLEWDFENCLRAYWNWDFEWLRKGTYKQLKTAHDLSMSVSDWINKSAITDPKDCDLEIIALLSIGEFLLTVNSCIIRVIIIMV